MNNDHVMITSNSRDCHPVDNVSLYINKCIYLYT